MKDYALPIVDYFDTIQESFNVRIPDDMVDFLNKQQKLQKEATLAATGGTFVGFGGEHFSIWKGGSAGGNKWVLENAVFQFHIRETDNWAISVRYLAAGIWQYGHDEVRRRAREAITSVCTPNERNFVRLSRVDYAMDFYSPAFSVECLSLLVAENMCLTSGVKAGIVFTSRSVETLTIGVSKGASLQIQVYNKTQHIKDKPEAAWIADIWEENGFCTAGEKRDVWRVEVRFKKDYLKDRNIDTFEDFLREPEKLLCEALKNRRMVIPTGSETKKERWDMHPLWKAAYEVAGDENNYLPRGRKWVGTRKAKAEMLEKQIKGLMRAHAVVENDIWDREKGVGEAEKLAREVDLDPDHDKKSREVGFKNQFIDEAK